MELDNFELNEPFIKQYIHNDRDKDIFSYKYDCDFLVNCKYRTKAVIGFNDVERISHAASLYNAQGVLVTTTDYSFKAKEIANKSNIILAYTNDIIKRLNLHIEQELDEKELDIIYNILY